MIFPKTCTETTEVSRTRDTCKEKGVQQDQEVQELDSPIGLLDNDRSGCVQTMNSLLSSNSVKGFIFCGNPCAISVLF